MTERQANAHAVIVGGSMAGMLAARALHDHFERITILDRDERPARAAHRAGVPHSKHLHLLLLGGQHVLEALFPGFTHDLTAAGSVPLRAGYDVLAVEPRGPWPLRDLGFTNNAQTRPLLEHVVRRRLRDYGRIETRWGCRVDGLLFDQSSRRVRGVHYHVGGAKRELEADLVIDASGRNARTFEWLDELGFPRPEETRIEVDFSYASAVFEDPAQPRLAQRSVAIGAEPPDKRGGVLQPIEGGRHMVSLAGRLGDHPPGDLEGFRAYAKSLHSPLIHEAIHDLMPLEPIARFRYPASVRRRYERLEAFPERLLPIGDALCSFNPVYGQGMSVAAKQAEALGKLVAEAAATGPTLDGLWRAFFPIAAEIVAAPWTQSGSADLAYPETVGKRPANFELAQQFSRGLAQLAIEDFAVHKLLFEVMQLAATRDAFRDPALIGRVMSVVQRSAN
jgi:2-polyprenyl-6-methoxyphenol hydroxylase-like FAD-dependent oxidoreductase